METPKEFFEKVVTPNYNEWLAKSGDIRLGINLSLSAYHLYDWFFHYYKERIKKMYGVSTQDKFLEKLIEECASFYVLHEMAKLYKHFSPRSNKSVTDTRKIRYHDGFRCGDSVDMPIDGINRVVTDNINESFHTIFFDVISMWIKTFERIGEKVVFENGLKQAK